MGLTFNGQGGRLETQGRAGVAVQSLKPASWQFFLAGREQGKRQSTFVLLRPSTDWMRTTTLPFA